MARVVVNLQPLFRWRDDVARDLRRGGAGLIRSAFHTWAIIFRSELQERFVRLSKGGGEWPGLAVSTLHARRRKAPGSGRLGAASAISARPRILWDRGVLHATLNAHFTGKPGAIQKDVAFGVRVGLGGGRRHPSNKSGATISQIARYHQDGGPSDNPPQRRIIVDPSESATRKMSEVMEVAVQRTYR